MDLAQAYAILGVDASTPLNDVRTAYLMRSQMLHPDKQSHRPSLHDEAEHAMKQLNVAWEKVQQAEREGQRGAVTAARAGHVARDAKMRVPVRGECDLCGSRPASPVTLRRVTGLVLFWSLHTRKAELCRNCGIWMFREMQAAGLIRGWWGIIAPLANLWIIVQNIEARRRILLMQPPSERDPNVVTPLPFPVPPGRTVLSRPGPWLATIGAALVALALITPSTQSTTTGDRTPRTNSNENLKSPVGSCLDGNGTMIACSSNQAVWKILREVIQEANCASYETVFTSKDNSHVYCAVRA